jgi:hypothetical protein
VNTTIRRIITHRENTIGGEGKKRNWIELKIGVLIGGGGEKRRERMGGKNDR